MLVDKNGVLLEHVQTWATIGKMNCSIQSWDISSNPQTKTGNMGLVKKPFRVFLQAHGKTAYK